MFQSSPDPPKALPELPQTLPKLLQGLPELTQRPAVPPEVPGADSGGGPSSQVRCGRIKTRFWELPAMPAAAPGSALCGGMDCGSGPPYHTRRGSG